MWLMCLLPVALQTIEFDDGAGAVLRIQPLRAPRDENIYECVARNSEGEVSVTAKLAIIRGEAKEHTHVLPPSFSTWMAPSFLMHKPGQMLFPVAWLTMEPCLSGPLQQADRIRVLSVLANFDARVAYGC